MNGVQFDRDESTNSSDQKPVFFAKVFMSSRKPLYVIGVILLAIVASLPQVELALRMGPRIMNGRRILGVGDTIEFGNQLTYSIFWQDRYLNAIQRSVGNQFLWEYVGIDPETGEESNLHFDWKNGYPRRYGNRLFLAPISFAKADSAEVIDGSPQSSGFFKHNDRSDNQFFLLDGEPAEIERGFGAGFGQRFMLRCFSKGAWTESLAIDVPNPGNTVQLGSRQFRFLDAKDVNILQQGDETHVFLYFNGFVLYRNGLKTKLVDSPFTETAKASLAEGNESAGSLPINEAQNSIDGWSLAAESTRLQTDSPPVPTEAVRGAMMISGQPAFMIVDRISTVKTVGSVFRFDGEKWPLFATQEFPFGANQFRTDARDDGQASYIVATTSMGVGHTYAVDANGIRSTNAALSHQSQFFWLFSGIPQLFMQLLIFEIIVLSVIGFLMWLYTRPNYEFGTQSVRLASLGRRGLARLIDLSLIIGSAFVLGRILTAHFDWMTWLEAINLKVDHPTIKELTRVVMVIVLWLGFAAIAVVYMQGRWSITPGKWLCGIRLVRTTLKPCGFARSLAREVVLSVDSCNLFCWTPGVLSIAFTNGRQRLGDLVADTIVMRVPRVDNQ